MTIKKSSNPYRSRYNISGEEINGKTIGPEMYDWVIADSCSPLPTASYGICDDNDVCDAFIQSDIHVPDNFQYSLDLSTIADKELELDRMKEKYERAWKTVGMYALRWHSLMEEVDNNPNIKAIFDDLQVIRKMSGGKVF